LICTRALVAGCYQGTPGTLPSDPIAQHIFLGYRSPASTNNKGSSSTKERSHTAKGIRNGHFLGANAWLLYTGSRKRKLLGKGLEGCDQLGRGGGGAEENCCKSEVRAIICHESARQKVKT